MGNAGAMVRGRRGTDDWFDKDRGANDAFIKLAMVWTVAVSDAADIRNFYFAALRLSAHRVG